MLHDICSIQPMPTHRQSELDGVDGLVERPGELMLPQRLDHDILHVLQLIGLAAGFSGIRHLGRWRVDDLRRFWIW